MAPTSAPASVVFGRGLCQQDDAGLVVLRRHHRVHETDPHAEEEGDESHDPVGPDAAARSVSGPRRALSHRFPAAAVSDRSIPCTSRSREKWSRTWAVQRSPSVGSCFCQPTSPSRACGHPRGVARFHQEPLELARQHLGTPARPCDESGTAGGQRLDDHPRARLVPERRHDHDVGGMQQHHHIATAPASRHSPAERSPAEPPGTRRRPRDGRSASPPPGACPPRRRCRVSARRPGDVDALLRIEAAVVQGDERPPGEARDEHGPRPAPPRRRTGSRHSDTPLCTTSMMLRD